MRVLTKHFTWPVKTILALAALLLAACGKTTDPVVQPGPVTLAFENVVGTQPLVLSTSSYKTSAGDDFTVYALKYYVSNVQFRRADNTFYRIPDSYYLLDQSAPGSLSLTLPNVPTGTYTGLSFMLGVDSTRTKGGNLTGSLDPNNNMFWAWSEEYINLKLEGTSPQSPRGGLIFHIAGYKGAGGANNTIRTVSPAFPAGSQLLVQAGRSPTVHLRADLRGLFGAPNPVRFATLNTTMGGAEAVRVADNIAAGMFSVQHIQAQ